MIHVPSGSRATPWATLRIASSLRTCASSESLGRSRIVTKTRVDRVAATVRSGDIDNSPIDIANTIFGGRDPGDRAIPQRTYIVAAADIDIVGAPVGRLDDQIMAIVDLVGEAALDNPSDNRPRRARQDRR